MTLSLRFLTRHAGFGKPAVILFLLLVLSLLAAAYCFVEANRQTGRHHRMQTAAAELRILATQLVVESVQPANTAQITAGIESGNALIQALNVGDAERQIPAIPALLAPELAAVDSAWGNVIERLAHVANSTRDNRAGRLNASSLDTLSGLNASLGNWLRDIMPDSPVLADQETLANQLLALREDIAALPNTPTNADTDRLVDVWRQVRDQVERLRAIDDADAAVLTTEMQQEIARLDAVLDPAPVDEDLAQSTFASQYAKNSEIQLLLSKLQKGLVVLEHEQNYLFRLGVVAALFSLLFLFLLAIVFWRDSENKVARSKLQNAANQRAILRLLDEITDLAEGDLSARATVTEDITGAIADSVNYAIDTICALVETINHVAENVSVAAEHTDETAKRLTRASAVQEREIRRSSNYITAMANTMQQMSSRADEAKTVAGQSVMQAKSGHAAVSEMVTGMGDIRQQIQDTAKRLKRLGESSQQIGDIIALVNDIAERTNLLALNAAIQASSRGGQQNFSAVSDEVQRLAERVNEATRDIEGLIVTIQADTRAAIASMEQSTTRVVKGSELAEQAGESLSEIQHVSHSVSGIIQEIADKSARQADVTAKLSGNMGVISEIACQTNEELRDTAGSIEKLHAMSKNLTESVSGFVLPKHPELSDSPIQPVEPEPDAEALTPSAEVADGEQRNA